MKWQVALAWLWGTGCAAAQSGEWRFTVTLDDKPIGTHVFRVAGTPAARMVESRADFRVQILGLTLFRYRHRATEQWRGDCLATLQATTEDDAPLRTVRAETREGRLAVTAADGAQTLEPCTMSFAYWHPALRQQTRLLNVQTGRVEAVRVVPAGDGTVAMRDQPTPAQRWRIEGLELPIDVWYAADGRWVGLESTVGGGRRLAYRLADGG